MCWRWWFGTEKPISLQVQKVTDDPNVYVKRLVPDSHAWKP